MANPGPVAIHASVDDRDEFGHVLVLLEHMRLSWLLRHFPQRSVHAVYVLVNCFITVTFLALLAFATGNPFIFPSVGPTAYLFFFTPLAKASSPRNAILGHGLGLVCGYGALLLTGAGHAAALNHSGIYWPSILAAAISLSGTGALMILLAVNHPPAGATTLIVSMGLISRPVELFVVEAAVMLLTAQAFAINRLAGVPYPLWNAPKSEPAGT